MGLGTKNSKCSRQGPGELTSACEATSKWAREAIAPDGRRVVSVDVREGNREEGYEIKNPVFDHFYYNFVRFSYLAGSREAFGEC